MPKSEKKEAGSKGPVKAALKKTAADAGKTAKAAQAVEKVQEAKNSPQETPSEFKKPTGVAPKKKQQQKGKAAPPPPPRVRDEESSSSSFNFEEDSESHSESKSSLSTSEISSSLTDEFKAQKLEIKLDDETTKKLTETLEQKKRPISEMKASDPRGVIYLGHLPYGFFEPQMRAFFSQFGVVTRLRISRNKKSGKSKHYAFVEFMDPIVAQIVADTMDGYMMYHRVLKCKVVPPEKVHPKMFIGANKKYVPKDTLAIQKQRVNRRKSPEEREKAIERLLEKEKEKREKIAAAGLDYDFPGYTAEAEKEKKRKSPEESAAPTTPREGERPTKKAKKQ